MSKSRITFYIIVGIVIFSACTYYVLETNKDRKNVVPPDAYLEESMVQNDFSDYVKQYSYFADKEFYDRSFDKARQQSKQVESIVKGGILPHHLLPADYIAGFYENLKKQDVSTVVVIGPNHYSVGYENIIISKALWETPYGSIRPDIMVLEALEHNGIAYVDEFPFKDEHSISAQVAFIKKVWPEAKIVPVLLKYGTTAEEASRLAQTLQENLDSDSLVLASVDFSHNQPAWVADFHDTMSRKVIENFDFDRIYDLEIDSPASIYALLSFLSLEGFQKTITFAHTNSSYLLDSLETTENTSYVFDYFTQGPPGQSAFASMLFVPDMMFDRSVKQKALSQGGYEYLFESLYNVEGQFFRGYDYLLGNLEGPITDRQVDSSKAYNFSFEPALVDILSKYRFDVLNLANNHTYDRGKEGYIDTKELLAQASIKTFGHPLQEKIQDVLYVSKGGFDIAFVGFNITDHTTEDSVMSALVSEAAEKTDIVVVSIHWGVEYQRQFVPRQQQLGRALIDAGADVIIGHHPHVVQPVEIYKNKLIFYSLGNFIFDQYFSKETQEGLMVGMAFSEDKHTYFLIPYTLPASQPQLMLGSDRQQFLKELADDSIIDEVRVNQLQSGQIDLLQDL